MTLLDPERLKVYDRALDFVVTAEKVAAATPRGHAALADQLRRASTSVAFNIAEGAGEFAAAEKVRFYRVARRSATECSAIVEVYRRLGFIDGARATEARSLVVEVVSMLVGLIGGSERRPGA